MFQHRQFVHVHASLQKMLNTDNSRGHLDNNFTFRIRFATQVLTNELHIYLERELESKIEGKMAEIDEFQSLSIVFVCAVNMKQATSVPKFRILTSI